MNKLLVYIAMTAVVAFALGFYVGGSGRSAAPPEAEVPEELDSVPPTTSTGGSAPIVPVTAEESKVSTTMVDAPSRFPREQMRESFAEALGQMLGDFFLLHQIPKDQADAIVKGLVENQVHAMEALETKAIQEYFSNDDASEVKQYEVNALIEAIQLRSEAKEQEVLGLYYEDYKEYRASIPQRQFLTDFSEALEEPLNSTTRDELLTIFAEESRPQTEPSSARFLGRPSREEIIASVKHQNEVVRERNARIKERVASYLTPKQYEQLAATLDKEVERTETMMRAMELKELSDMD